MSDDPIETLKGRFDVYKEIGRGSQARTFLGLDRESGERVAIKELSLENAADWKAVELFEREARALRGLDHPAIPRHIDDFHIDAESGVRFFLIQEFIEGEDLKSAGLAGTFSDQDARRFVEEMLDVLCYLQDLSPPVVHRDIKPSNIVRRPDGRLTLVDFGAVQTMAANTVGGSTVVGTSGYMPPEQLLGHATPASDLYALAATTVQLLTNREPSELAVHRMQLQFRDHVSLSPQLADWLDQMLAPSTEARFKHGREALASLRAAGSTDLQLEPEPRTSMVPLAASIGMGLCTTITVAITGWVVLVEPLTYSRFATAGSPMSSSSMIICVSVMVSLAVMLVFKATNRQG